MNRKTIAYLIIVGLTAVFILSGLHSKLYFKQTEFDSQYSASSHIIQNYQPDKWGQKVGLYFDSVQQTNLLTEKLARYLKAYLKQSGYQKVRLIQGQLPKDLELDLLINCDFKSVLSIFPLFKQGKLKSNFSVRSFKLWPELPATKRFAFNYQGQTKLTIEGFSSQEEAYTLLLKQTAKQFVAKLNQEVNNRFKLGLPEQLSPPVLSSPVNLPTNNNNNKLRERYRALIPADSRQVEITEYGNWTLMSFVTNQPRQKLKTLLPTTYQINTKSWSAVKNIKTGDYDNTPKKLYLKVTGEKEHKHVQLLLWDYGSCLEVLQDYEQYRNQATGYLSELKSRLQMQTHSFFYCFAKLKLLEQQIKETYWLQGKLDTSLIDKCLQVIGEMKLPAYLGADDFYRGDLYQQLGVLTRNSKYLSRAVDEYKQIIANYERRKFGLGAKKRLLQIKANPIYNQHDYQAVLKEIRNSKVDNLDLAITEAEVLFKLGCYQKALAKIEQAHCENRKLAVIVRAKLGKSAPKIKELRDYDLRREVEKKMTLLYNYYLRNKKKRAVKIAEDLKLNYPLWMIKEQVDEFYRRTGIELTVF